MGQKCPVLSLSADRIEVDKTRFMLKQKFANLFLLIVVSTTFFNCKKKEDDKPAPVVPVIKIEDASQARTTTGSVLHFMVTMNRTTTVPVTVDYTFTDGTAKSPADYTATAGTLTIPANSSGAQIDVPIKADPTDTRQSNLDFTIDLSNPKAGVLGVNSAKGTIITENGTNITTDNTGYTTPLTYPGYTLDWNDE